MTHDPVNRHDTVGIKVRWSMWSGDWCSGEWNWIRPRPGWNFPTFPNLSDGCWFPYDFLWFPIMKGWSIMIFQRFFESAGDDRSLGGTRRKFSFQSTFLGLESRRRFLVLCFNKLSTGSREADHFMHPVQRVRQGSDARSLEDWKDAISQIEENIKERKPMQPWFASHASVIFKNARAAAHCSSCRLVFFQFQSSHAGNTCIYIYI